MIEIWKDIKGFEGLYQVSNLGNIKSSYSNKNLNILKDKDGYGNIKLYKTKKQFTKKVHRLVAEAFIPNPENLPQVNHKDENKLNNSVTNLEWCSQEYNMNYGTINSRLSNSEFGSKNHKAKKVQCIETGEVFGCCRDADRKYNLIIDSVRNAANPKRNQQLAGGYHWKFI